VRGAAQHGSAADYGTCRSGELSDERAQKTERGERFGRRAGRGGGGAKRGGRALGSTCTEVVGLESRAGWQARPQSDLLDPAGLQRVENKWMEVHAKCCAWLRRQRLTQHCKLYKLTFTFPLPPFVAKPGGAIA